MFICLRAGIFGTLLTRTSENTHLELSTVHTAKEGAKSRDNEVWFSFLISEEPSTVD